ncbi:hypothetical protein LTR56_024189 [Elasticomyces elasticus]|nr:hypothetical protein LTR56_024189 [Elasticomyces elasticus]KAK3640582.1 hypothetical protein LTR22_016958 [Elasticomyces elasticus]KAK4910214.1 hypothetical protein LTR49_021105 [Elasticomyces elasticus]KAK5759956.1 hypothetical protein LTS12_009852 [Elasticomyces elasticus]
MRLLKLGSLGALEFVECSHGSIPRYAILSHTWGEDKDEVTFDDICNGTGKDKAGFAKIDFCARQAKQDGMGHFWVDTCCINKANFTELSKAINSMFGWYQHAEKCYVYLTDVSSNKRDHRGQPREVWDGTFNGSRWFTRGWTLQELLAPKSVDFFSREGVLLGDRQSLGELIQVATGIPSSALQGGSLSTFTVDERMRWAARRDTKEPEDKWYSLLGLFDVNMSLIYGEGEKAACRLKDEIAKSLRERMDISKRDHGTSAPGSSAAECRDMLLASLAFEQMDSRRATIKAAYATTCQWFVDHPAYLAWLDPGQLNQHQGFLWVKGKPGAGKSTLMKFAHAHALKKTSENELLISFFFNARGEELERSVVGMYRSLLCQLLKEAPGLHKVFDEEDWNNHQSRNSTWTIDSLRDLFAVAVKALKGRHLKCFVDALDECDEEQVQDMVDFFQELGQHVFQEGNGDHIQICFASRHYPAVVVQHGLELTLESQKGHSDDLAKYVQKRLRAGKGKLIEGVRSQICEKANGVFLWVVLVVEILNKEFLAGRMFALKKRLHEIPPKLSDLFKDILRRDIVNMDDLLLCLQWVLFAKRPLTREEFYYAMLAGIDPEPETLAAWDPEQVTTDDMDRYVLSSSKGLAELTKSKAPSVQFIHESVRDFLIKDGGMYELWPNLGSNFPGLAHDRLKYCCESYIAINAPPYGSLHERQSKASSETAKMLRANLALRYPFLEYAGQHLLDHADEAALVTPQHDFLERIALAAFVELRNVFERYDKRRYTIKASLPYLLAEGGHARLMRAARERGTALNIRGERYQFPLFAAIACGHRHVVGALLQSEDFPTNPDLTQHMRLGRDFLAERDLQFYTPLLWAIEEGHESAAERLRAVEKHDEEMVRLLLKHGVNVRGSGAIHKATSESMVKLLLDNGADVNELHHIYGTPVGSAALNGHKAVVELLIHCLADDFRNFALHGQALYNASSRGHEAVVRLLLNASADRKPENGVKGTALQAASEQGHVRIVALLLNHGVDVNDGFVKPLELACRQGHDAVVRALLAHGGLTSRSRGYHREIRAAITATIVELLDADLALDNARLTE